jgi:hypothetical protein
MKFKVTWEAERARDVAGIRSVRAITRIALGKGLILMRISPSPLHLNMAP